MISEPDEDTWRSAEQPNYATNIDLMFPYSDLYCLQSRAPSSYKKGATLVKIPVPPNNLIEHVEYWGEGRVEVEGKVISGFSNSYNINYQFKLVSSGLDKGKRIPNRIPVFSYTDPDNSDTSDYIKDNSVLAVTVLGARITSNSIKDIARIVAAGGMVVVYAVSGTHDCDHAPHILELTKELEKKKIFPSGNYTLPSALDGLENFDIKVVFLSTDYTDSTCQSETSLEVWRNAGGPNYSTNIDLLYPYSDVHIPPDTNLNKIPFSRENLIQHVDYWGEGRVVNAEGISGFPNSYNVNREFALVSSGPDRDKKIPNRIPVSFNSHGGCHTAPPPIKDNSVLLVTVEAAGITKTAWCSKDIARIVNDDRGKVVVYGVQNDSEVFDLQNELKEKELFLSKDYTLPSELQGLTRYDKHVTFLNKKDLGELTYSHVINGNYDSAVIMSKGLGKAISEIVRKLIRSAPRNVMIYAYKLWHDGDDAYKEIVRDYFQKPFQYLMDGQPVTIANKQHDMYLKIYLNLERVQLQGPVSIRDILGDGTGLHKTDSSLSWRFHPTCYKDNLTFTVSTVDVVYFMKMNFNVAKNGDRSCWGVKMFPGGDKTGQGAGNYLYHLEPLIGADDDLMFIITNVRYKQGLKLFVKTNGNGDRRLCGHDGNIHNVDHNRFKWVISPLPEVKGDEEEEREASPRSSSSYPKEEEQREASSRSSSSSPKEEEEREASPRSSSSYPKEEEEREASPRSSSSSPKEEEQREDSSRSPSSSPNEEEQREASPRSPSSSPKEEKQRVDPPRRRRPPKILDPEVEESMDYMTKYGGHDNNQG